MVCRVELIDDDARLFRYNVGLFAIAGQGNLRVAALVGVGLVSPDLDKAVADDREMTPAGTCLRRHRAFGVHDNGAFSTHRRKVDVTLLHDNGTFRIRGLCFSRIDVTDGSRQHQCCK